MSSTAPNAEPADELSEDEGRAGDALGACCCASESELLVLPRRPPVGVDESGTPAKVTGGTITVSWCEEDTAAPFEVSESSMRLRLPSASNDGNFMDDALPLACTYGRCVSVPAGVGTQVISTGEEGELPVVPLPVAGVGMGVPTVTAPVPVPESIDGVFSGSDATGGGGRT
jgi:hypothetical protein